MAGELARRGLAGRRVAGLGVAGVDDQRTVDYLDVVVEDAVVVLAETDAVGAGYAIGEDVVAVDGVVRAGADVDHAGAGADGVVAEGVAGALERQDLGVAVA